MWILGLNNADNGLYFLAPSADSHKKVNLANSGTLLSTVCCLKRPFLYEGKKKPSVEIMSMFLALGNTEQDEM